MSIASKKHQLREQIWNQMEQSRIAVFPLPCKGRIPNFVGAEIAAEKLCRLKEWKESRVIFANPDSSQREVRENALKDAKILVMASPRLEKGFILIRPEDVKGRERSASTIRGAFRYGVRVQNFPKPDLIIQGSVAVDTHGRRLGKGHGYGDIEIKRLKEKFGTIPIVTTVHDIQIVGEVPFEEKDERVSIVVTPTKVVHIRD